MFLKVSNKAINTFVYSKFLEHIKHFISGFCLSLSFNARSYNEFVDFISSHFGITFPTYILGKLLHILWDSAQASTSSINFLLLPHNKGRPPLCFLSIFYIPASIVASFSISLLVYFSPKPKIHTLAAHQNHSGNFIKILVPGRILRDTDLIQQSGSILFCKKSSPVILLCSPSWEILHYIFILYINIGLISQRQRLYLVYTYIPSTWHTVSRQ